MECLYCQKPLVKREGERPSHFTRRQTCGRRCANGLIARNRYDGKPRTKSAYHQQARRHRKKHCATCRSTLNLEVHHRDGDHTNNDPKNLATLCRVCHSDIHKHKVTDPERLKELEDAW